jgi:hypothetical protein
MFVKLIKTFKNETKVQWILSTTSSASSATNFAQERAVSGTVSTMQECLYQV